MAFDHGNDLCLGFWAKALEAEIIHVPNDANVLEIGCAEADWISPSRAAFPDWSITGVDFRACDRPRSTFICGDIRQQEFGEGAFDLVVAISALEHFGLGAYGDPEGPDADVETTRLVGRWLKPGGWFYFDVPFGDGNASRKFRRYTDAMVRERLVPAGCDIRWWRQFTPEHPDAPYVGVICQKV